MEYSDYFILRFGGDNVLKGLVVNSAEMQAPTETEMGEPAEEPSKDDHFLQFEANLHESTILITTDLFHREAQGIRFIIPYDSYRMTNTTNIGD